MTVTMIIKIPTKFILINKVQSSKLILSKTFFPKFEKIKHQSKRSFYPSYSLPLNTHKANWGKGALYYQYHSPPTLKSEITGKSFNFITCLWT